MDIESRLKLEALLYIKITDLYLYSVISLIYIIFPEDPFKLYVFQVLCLPVVDHQLNSLLSYSKSCQLFLSWWLMVSMIVYDLGGCQTWSHLCWKCIVHDPKTFCCILFLHICSELAHIACSNIACTIYMMLLFLFSNFNVDWMTKCGVVICNKQK